MPGTINSRNPNSQSVFENSFVKTLSIAVLMGIFLVDMGLGLFEIFSTKESPLPTAVVLLIFAVIFIAGMVFYEKQGLDTLRSLVGGALAGFGFSVACRRRAICTGRRDLDNWVGSGDFSSRSFHDCKRCNTQSTLI